MTGRLRGITELLRRRFWPNYNYRNATKGAPKTKSSNAFKGRRAGFKRGNAVDHEIRAFVNKGIKPEQPYTRKILKALALAGMKPIKAQVGEVPGELALPYDP